MSERTKDVVLGAVFVLMGLGAYLEIQYGEGRALQMSRDVEVTFRTFPIVISVLMMVLGAVFMALNVWALLQAKRRLGPSPAPSAEQAAASRRAKQVLGLRVVALLVLLLAYTYAIGTMPFVVLTALFLFFSFFVFGQKSVLKNALVAVTGGAAFHFLFVTLLKLPLY